MGDPPVYSRSCGACGQRYQDGVPSLCAHPALVYCSPVAVLPKEKVMGDPTVRADILRRIRGSGGAMALQEFEKLIRAEERRIVLAELRARVQSTYQRELRDEQARVIEDPILAADRDRPA